MTPPAGSQILLVDDNGLDRMRVRRLLGRSNLAVTVTEAHDVASALSLYSRGDFACVLLDHRLPDGDGVDQIHLFNRERTAVVMLTGLGDQTVAVEALKRGAKDYLVKDGLTADALKTAVVNALEKTRLEQESREKNKRLEEMSFNDALTGLPNRNLFSDRLEQCIRSAEREARRFVVFMMDLNLFKEVNDTYGHDAGDELLHIVGRRLDETLRDSDTLARFGGDEFAALLPSTDSPAGAAVLAERAYECVTRPICLRGLLIEVSVAIGIAVYPDHGETAKSLLHAADSAMYSAKYSGKSFVIWDGELGTSSLIGLVQPRDLKQGLKEGHFTLHYQPKVEMRTGMISGVEALVSWDHPELGQLSPMGFIPSAERMALIRPLTMAVLNQAAAQVKQWETRGLALTVAVNLSPRLLSNEGLVEDVHNIIRKRGLSPTALTLEITESSAIADPALAQKTLTELSESGVRVAIDDFGTGYTSLRLLRDLPVSEVKIDQLFISNLLSSSKDASIVRAIIDLAHALEIAVVAEGVETSEVWHQLLELGCDFGQGHAIAAPMSSDAIERICADWQGRVDSRRVGPTGVAFPTSLARLG